MVYVLALGAALASAAGGVLQRLGVETAPAEAAMRLGLLRHALRRGVWVAGFGLLLATFALQATALRFGALNVVQPLLTVELLFLVVILVVFFGQRPGRREWAGIAALVAGLIGFLVAAHPTAGHGIPSGADWVVVVSLVAGGAAVLTVAARRGPRWWRATAYGAASAGLFALNAAITKSLTALITHGWAHVFTHFEPYGIAVAGALGFFLLQNALHAGPIAAAKASMVVVNPLVSVAIGATVFAERLDAGPLHLVIEGLTLAVMCAGAVVLARSPMVADPAGEQLGRSRVPSVGDLVVDPATPGV